MGIAVVFGSGDEDVDVHAVYSLTSCDWKCGTGCVYKRIQSWRFAEDIPKHMVPSAVERGGTLFKKQIAVVFRIVDGEAIDGVM